MADGCPAAVQGGDGTGTVCSIWLYYRCLYGEKRQKKNLNPLLFPPPSLLPPPNVFKSAQILSRYCDLANEVYKLHYSKLPREDVTAVFESMLKCIRDAQACCAELTEAQWRQQRNDAQLPRLRLNSTGNGHGNRNAAFSRHLQRDEALCNLLQESCRLLMDHVVQAAQPIFDSIAEAG